MADRKRSGKNKRKIDDVIGSETADASRKEPRFWTTEDDDFLRAAVERHGEQYWTKVAKDVPGRNAKECVQRWKKVLAPGLKKGKWSDQEDLALIELIRKHGQNWTLLSECMKTRSSKQCRERWMNHLNPDLKKTKWTDEEDEKLLELAARYPRKWAEMARGIPGRTENMAKCRFHTLIRRKAKLERLKNGEKRKYKKRALDKPSARQTTVTKQIPAQTHQHQPQHQLQQAVPHQVVNLQAQVKPQLVANQIRDLENLLGKHLLNSAPNPGVKTFSLPPYPSNVASLSSLQYPALLKAAAGIGYNPQSPPVWYLDYQNTLSQQPNFASQQHPHI